MICCHGFVLPHAVTWNKKELLANEFLLRPLSRTKAPSRESKPFPTKTVFEAFALICSTHFEGHMLDRVQSVGQNDVKPTNHDSRTNFSGKLL